MPVDGRKNAEVGEAVAGVVAGHRDVVRPAEIDLELIADEPPAERRTIRGDVEDPVAVVVGGHRAIARHAELHREPVADEPGAGRGAIHRDVGRRVAVVVARRRSRDRGPWHDELGGLANCVVESPRAIQVRVEGR